MDDWSHIPDRNAVSEPAPNHPSTMTTTALPARLTRPRQAPATGTAHPCPQTGALDPAALARRSRTQSGAAPRNHGNLSILTYPTSERPHERQRPRTLTLDITQPFMDDFHA
jgi:hypothetical protein